MKTNCIVPKSSKTLKRLHSFLWDGIIAGTVQPVCLGGEGSIGGWLLLPMLGCRCTAHISQSLLQSADGFLKKALCRHKDITIKNRNRHSSIDSTVSEDVSDTVNDDTGGGYAVGDLTLSSASDIQGLGLGRYNPHRADNTGGGLVRGLH